MVIPAPTHLRSPQHLVPYIETTDQICLVYLLPLRSHIVYIMTLISHQRWKGLLFVAANMIRGGGSMKLCKLLFLDFHSIM